MDAASNMQAPIAPQPAIATLGVGVAPPPPPVGPVIAAGHRDGIAQPAPASPAQTAVVNETRIAEDAAPSIIKPPADTDRVLKPYGVAMLPSPPTEEELRAAIAMASAELTQPA